MVVVEKLILIGYNVFMMGHYGDFDRLALSVCRELRSKYKNIDIVLVVVKKSLLTKKLLPGGIHELADVEVYYEDIKTLVYPIEEEYFKQQIIKNNMFMVDDSDLVLSYIDNEVVKSGAKRAVNYAEKTGKKIINIFKAQDRPFFNKTPKQKEEYKQFLKKHNE